MPNPLARVTFFAKFLAARSGWRMACRGPGSRDEVPLSCRARRGGAGRGTSRWLRSVAGREAQPEGRASRHRHSQNKVHPTDTVRGHSQQTRPTDTAHRHSQQTQSGGTANRHGQQVRRDKIKGSESRSGRQLAVLRHDTDRKREGVGPRPQAALPGTARHRAAGFGIIQ